MAETRLQVPGGWMSAQELRDLVAWAGAAGAEYLVPGDRQDWHIASPSTAKLPSRLVLQPNGSLQSSAYGPVPTAAHPWLTTGVWMDVLSQIDVPLELDVQLLHEAARPHFGRWGHVRLTARRSPHQWSVALRRPGTNRLVQVDNVDTGGIPGLVQDAAAAWAYGNEAFWEGTVVSESVVPDLSREGFHETASAFSLGLWSSSGFRVEHLRDVAWLAWESGAHRVWLTPDRVLLIQGIGSKHRPAWDDWLARTRLQTRHSDVARSVRPAGTQSMTASNEVAAWLHAADRLPSGGAVLVADEAVNRGDGVCGPFPVLIRTPQSWLFRSGGRSGEGTLNEVLAALDQPAPEPAPAVVADPGLRRCSSCLTIYDPQWGDPRGGIIPLTPFEDIPGNWSCPVCGGPRDDFASMPNAAASLDHRAP